MSIVEIKIIGGIKGDKGDAGANGASAYQLWLAAGNVGTIDDFLASSKGEKGDKGDPGDTTSVFNIGQTYQFLEGAIPTQGTFISIDTDADTPVDPSTYPLLAPYLADVEGTPIPGVETQAVADDIFVVNYLNGWNTSDIGSDKIAVDTRDGTTVPYYQFVMPSDGTHAELHIELNAPKRLIRAFTAGPNISSLMAPGACDFSNGNPSDPGVENANGNDGHSDFYGNNQIVNFTNATNKIVVRWFNNAFGPGYVGQIAIMQLWFEGEPTPVMVKGLKANPYLPEGYVNVVYAGA
jgi:hypothetical protein